MYNQQIIVWSRGGFWTEVGEKCCIVLSFSVPGLSTLSLSLLRILLLAFLRAGFINLFICSGQEWSLEIARTKMGIPDWVVEIDEDRQLICTRLKHSKRVTTGTTTERDTERKLYEDNVSYLIVFKTFFESSTFNPSIWCRGRLIVQARNLSLSHFSFVSFTLLHALRLSRRRETTKFYLGFLILIYDYVISLFFIFWYQKSC